MDNKPIKCYIYSELEDPTHITSLYLHRPRSIRRPYPKLSIHRLVSKGGNIDRPQLPLLLVPLGLTTI